MSLLKGVPGPVGRGASLNTERGLPHELVEIGGLELGEPLGFRDADPGLASSLAEADPSRVANFDGSILFLEPKDQKSALYQTPG